MPDLIAQGASPRDRWRRKLPLAERIVLGRESPDWATPWDGRISSNQVEILWNGRQLEVQRLPSSRNPVFVHGQSSDRFTINTGNYFIVGDTTFELVDEPIVFSIDSKSTPEERAYSPGSLARVRFHNADHRIEVLSGLPEVVAGASCDSDLFISLVNLLLAGIPRADAVALVKVDLNASKGKRIEIMQWDRRRLAAGPFQPSERLIVRAVENDQSIAHFWSQPGKSENFTAIDDVNWAFCTPIPNSQNSLSGIYVAGNFSSNDSYFGSVHHPVDLKEEIKFTELVASLVKSLRELRDLEYQSASLSQFFSPVVLKALSGKNPEVVLSPKACEVTVLFCDLRGFSRASADASEDLFGLLNRVSKALGVATRHILDQGGVVGDFHGDAVMGFWGWPLAQEDAVERACSSALCIRAELEKAAKQSDSPLAGFRMGIGIATGEAVAGRIGTIDQVKVTVFGPVVNLASRIEGMTKRFKARILVDQRTAEIARKSIRSDRVRVRRVATVQPFGLDGAHEVSEILPPFEEFDKLSDQDIANYEAALDAFQEGDWSQAFMLLHQVPSADRVKDFLMVFIAQHNRSAPLNWRGFVPLSSKE